MEQVSFKDVKNLNKKDDTTIKKELIKSYTEALKRPEFKALVTKIKAKDDIAMKYTSKLERVLEELSNCKNCKGLNNCNNPVTGCVYYPKKENDRLLFDYVTCKYKKGEEEKAEKKSKFFDMPIQVQDAKMSEIDLKDKNRVEVIKWVNKFYKDYQKDKHIKGLYLHGSFGSGKSYILSALLNEISANGEKCVICYYPEILRSLKESFAYPRDFKEMMDELKNANILLLDDIGAEAVSEWNRDEILNTVLQYRMESKLPTFFTSNFNLSELEDHLKETKNSLNLISAKRIIERIKQLTDDIELISENRRS